MLKTWWRWRSPHMWAPAAAAAEASIVCRSVIIKIKWNLWSRWCFDVVCLHSRIHLVSSRYTRANVIFRRWQLPRMRVFVRRMSTFGFPLIFLFLCFFCLANIFRSCIATNISKSVINKQKSDTKKFCLLAAVLSIIPIWRDKIGVGRFDINKKRDFFSTRSLHLLYVIWIVKSRRIRIKCGRSVFVWWWWWLAWRARTKNK